MQVTGDILVLAGDIGYLGDENYSNHPFWDWASENYQQVIVCMGNHEFYKYYDIANLNDGFCLEIRPNVHSYYNAVVHIEDVDFIVTTLWSKIPLKEAYYTEQVISDFRRIFFNEELLTFADFNHEHDRCLAFLKKQFYPATPGKRLLLLIMYRLSKCNVQSLPTVRQTEPLP